MNARKMAAILALLMLTGHALGSVAGVSDAQKAALFLAATVFVAVGLLISYWDERK
jgi:hypothetical protein